MTAISVRNLRKVYGNKAAVDGLNLEVPRGCFFGFLGPNGAGKSTTIRMLTGLIPPNSGEIELLGMPMPEQEIEIKKRIGLVPDESLLFDRLTGAEFLEFVGRMYGLARPRRQRARARPARLCSSWPRPPQVDRANIPKACASAWPWRRR